MRSAACLHRDTGNHGCRCRPAAGTMGCSIVPRERSSWVKEMLIVGRGGEGVVLASQLLADTFARAGFWAQSFPEFKAERRGAPISAFLRWDEVADPPPLPGARLRRARRRLSLAPDAGRSCGRVRPGGLVVLNREERFPHTGPFDIARVPASRIARDHDVLSSEGRPMGNVAVLGACVKLLLPDGLGFLEEAIAAADGRRCAELNVVAAREGYARCTRQRARAGDVPLEPAGGNGRAAPPRRSTPLFPVSTTDSLANHTGSWSLDRPVLSDACTACAVCALFCPEGAITRADGAMVIDYLYCKGCGICEVVCPVRNAISDGGGARHEPGAAARTHGADGRRGSGVRGDARARPRDRLLSDHAADGDRRAARGPRRGAGRRRVRERRERARDVRLRHRRVAGRRPDLHGDLVAGAAVRARAAAPSVAGARAARRRQHQPGGLRPLEHPAGPLGQHEPARHRLDPAVLLVGAGGAGQRPLRLPDRRGGDAAGDGVRRGLPALAHLGGRRGPGAERGGRVPARAAARPRTGCSTRSGRGRSRRCRSRTTTSPSSATSRMRWTTRAG